MASQCRGPFSRMVARSTTWSFLLEAWWTWASTPSSCLARDITGPLQSAPKSESMMHHVKNGLHSSIIHLDHLWSSFIFACFYFFHLFSTFSSSFLASFYNLTRSPAQGLEKHRGSHWGSQSWTLLALRQRTRGFWSCGAEVFQVSRLRTKTWHDNTWYD